MVTVEQLLGFGVAAFFLIVVPGPSVIFVVGRALSYGRLVALASVFGNTLGLLIVVTTVSFGLGVVIAVSIVLFTMLKFIGAAYLIWLGIIAFRKRGDFGMAAGDAVARTQLSVSAAVRQGLTVGISNPKAFMIFAALLPQFVDFGHDSAQTQMFLLGLVAVALGFITDITWALTASGLRSWLVRSRRRGEAVGAVGGLSMIGLGVGLAATGHRS